MIRTFRNEDTEAVFSGEFVKGLDRQIQQRAREKLKYLDSAIDLRDLMIPPSSQLEALKATAKASTVSGLISNGAYASSGGTETRSMSRSLITIERTSRASRHDGN
jgi:plasmid maintenance system killer protein